MITAVDTSVILDILVNDNRFAGKSELFLRRAFQEGKLIVCECVMAELVPSFQSTELFLEFINDWNLVFSPVDLESAKTAGRYFKQYLSRGGKAKRVLPDFLIGAHALNNADRLLARDRGYLKDYFKKLKVWEPV